MPTPINNNSLFLLFNYNVIPYLTFKTLRVFVRICKTASESLELNTTWRQVCITRWPALRYNSSLEKLDWKTQVYLPLQQAYEREALVIQERLELYKSNSKNFFSDPTPVAQRPTFKLDHRYDNDYVRMSKWQFFTKPAPQSSTSTVSDAATTQSPSFFSKPLFYQADVLMMTPSFKVLGKEQADLLTKQALGIFKKRNICLQFVELKTYEMTEKHVFWQGAMRFTMVGRDAKMHAYDVHFEADSFMQGFLDVYINRAVPELRFFKILDRYYGANTTTNNALVQDVQQLIGDDIVRAFGKQKRACTQILLFWLRTIPHNVLDQDLYELRSLIEDKRMEFCY